MATKDLWLGVDIGAHKVCLSLFDGKKLTKAEYNPYPQRIDKDPKKWHEWLLSDVHDFILGKTIAAAGICSAGVVENGIIKTTPNIPALTGINLMTLLEPLVHVNAADNDAKAFLICESFLGAAQKNKNALGITLGTGIGGAALSSGRLVRGRHNGAGEIGHMIIDKKQSFEKLASARFFTKHRSDPIESAQAARNGDQNAQELFFSYGTYVGVGLSNVINMYDPDIVVLGGGLSHAYDLFIDAARTEIRKYVLLEEAKNVPVIASTFGRHASSLGAAILSYKASHNLPVDTLM